MIQCGFFARKKHDELDRMDLTLDDNNIDLAIRQENENITNDDVNLVVPTNFDLASSYNGIDNIMFTDDCDL